MNEKEKFLRYAELTFRKERLQRESQPVPDEVVKEIESIREEVKLSHEAIIDLVVRNLTEDL